MRKTISFIAACAVLAFGLWLLAMQVFFSSVIYGKALFGAAACITLGAAWLFGDFVLPALRRKSGN